MTTYSYKAMEQAISHLVEKGYEAVQIDEGTLGIGHWILLAPDDSHYNFEIQERYLNCWSSGQTIRRFSKPSKRIQALLDGKI